MYGSFITDSTWPRTNRATPIQLRRPTIRITFALLGPSIVTSTIRSTKSGIDMNMSVTRMIALATHPPKYPAITPRTVPRPELIATAASATAIETRPPTRTRVRMSRPNVSVPSGWAGLGPSRASGSRIR